MPPNRHHKGFYHIPAACPNPSGPLGDILDVQISRSHVQWVVATHLGRTPKGAGNKTLHCLIPGHLSILEEALLHRAIAQVLQDNMSSKPTTHPSFLPYPSVKKTSHNLRNGLFAA